MLTIQFAFDSTRGFILPFDHVDNPLDSETKEDVRKTLREYFSRTFDDPGQLTSYQIYHNAKFDLTVIRNALGLPIIHWEVWDTMAGAQAGDENGISHLSRYKQADGNSLAALGQLFAWYGNDFYYESEFKKSDRADIANHSLFDPDFLAYCSMDVQSIFRIHELQIEAAGLVEYEGKPYTEPFKRFVLKQMSSNINLFAHMEHRGCYIDMDYLMLLMGRKSPLKTIVKEETKALFALESTQAANARILKMSNVPSEGIFGPTWAFDLGKTAHRRTLFFDILKLKPITVGVDGPSTDKHFQEVYAAEYPEVSHLARISKVSRLITNFVTAFWNRIQESDDSKFDSRIHPSYGFHNVVTGRSSCRNPSLQQMPTRSKEAKYIKRMFTGDFGQLIIKNDYSAHEVRVWSIISGDTELAVPFYTAYNLFAEYYRTENPALLPEIKLKSDMHKINANRFYGVAIEDVDDELRAATKTVVFGAIYDKSVRSMAATLKQTEEAVQRIYDKFFSVAKLAKAWLDRWSTISPVQLRSWAPTGRIRHTPGLLTGIDSIVSAIIRRNKNSPIQGMAADITHAAARLYMQEVHKFFVYAGIIDESTTQLPDTIDSAVHDSMISGVPYEYVAACIHLRMHMCTIGITNWYRQVMGIVFTIPVMIDIEVGFAQSHMHKWDYSISQLKEITLQALKDKVELEPELDVELEHKKMWDFYAKHRDHLETNYPLFPDYSFEEAKRLHSLGL